jgi:hypothetical protein
MSKESRLKKSKIHCQTTKYQSITDTLRLSQKMLKIQILNGYRKWSVKMKRCLIKSKFLLQTVKLIFANYTNYSPRNVQDTLQEGYVSRQSAKQNSAHSDQMEKSDREA